MNKNAIKKLSNTNFKSTIHTFHFRNNRKNIKASINLESTYFSLEFVTICFLAYLDVKCY